MTTYTRRGLAGMVAGGLCLPLAKGQSLPPLTPVAPLPDAVPANLLANAERRAEDILKRQVLDESQAAYGGYLDAYGLLTPQAGAGVMGALGAVWLCPGSRFHRDKEVARRLELGARFLDRMQLPSGNIDLLSTNFDSPPDTGFVVHAVAPVAILAQRAGETELLRAVQPFLRKAGKAMAIGGIHTPNHRWVVAAALALLNHLEPDAAYTRRAAEWLAEGIDIDADGLYTERSPLVYTPVVNRSLIYMAEFLNRAELLEPVERSLQAALWLMHPNGELVTELSGRQDQNMIGSMGVNWLALQYLAQRAANPVYAQLAQRFQQDHGDLLPWLLLPQMQQRSTKPAGEPPARYEKDFRDACIWRYRHDQLSDTVLYRGYDRVLAIRKGDAVLEALRFGSAFFGKGQFVSQESRRDGDTFTITQQLRAPYYQPLDPPRRIPSDPIAWGQSRQNRKQTEIAELTQQCIVRREGQAFVVTIEVSGTPNVPVSVEMNIRNGVEISNVRSAPMGSDSFLTTGEPLLLRAGGQELRVEAAAATHGYTQLRGALPKLPGRSVYLTGASPFRQNLRIS